MNRFPVRQPADRYEFTFATVWGYWAVVSPQDVTAMLANFDRPWWIAGGWAIDASTGAHRDHTDIDVGVFRRDVPALWELFDPAMHLWPVSSRGLRPLDSENPKPDKAALQLWLRENAREPWLVDFLLTPQRNGAWVHRRDHSVAKLDDVT